MRAIFPYKKGCWMFDDPSVALKGEPFVLGMNEIIDEMVCNLKDPESGFIALFSDVKFPKYTHKLKFKECINNGNWYELHGTKMVGWLCPALYKYFVKAPKTIYVRVENLETKNEMRNEQTTTENKLWE
jgi:hypothetical protein